MDPNEEVLRQIRESKRIGEYSLQSFRIPSNGIFNQELGYGSSSGGHINQHNIDADSFLKNLHMKTTKKIVFNPLNQSVNSKPTIVPMSKPINITSKQKRSCNENISKQDISSRFYSVNIKNPQEHINYNIGLDSRHEKR
jgi:hypothetical protein